MKLIMVLIFLLIYSIFNFPATRCLIRNSHSKFLPNVIKIKQAEVHPDQSKTTFIRIKIFVCRSAVIFCTREIIRARPTVWSGFRTIAENHTRSGNRIWNSRTESQSSNQNIIHRLQTGGLYIRALQVFNFFHSWMTNMYI